MADKIDFDPSTFSTEGGGLLWVPWEPTMVIEAMRYSGEIVSMAIFELNLQGTESPTDIIALRLPSPPIAAVDNHLRKLNGSGFPRAADT